jgi:predicted DNA-binding transcriptional regulator AlpA
MLTALPADFRILLEDEVVALTRLSPVTLWRLERKKACPRRIKLGAKRVGWIEAEVLGWIAARMSDRAA